ncbi:enoyl-CoA hydratase/isomerase family protein [Burkholderia alba]|uniref:enoyl-CoA hydratase/isomerase family protein n=1 Tax=Burkholderia alba TaxID=2683677 RepID=UPI002B061178|nr:enoyl-CoA hydratase/isomerase family protein [Burkholderia alba]
MIEILTPDAPIVELRIARAPLNLIDIEALRALRRHIADAEAAATRGIVISGLPGVFSSGVDMAPLVNSDRDTVRAYWREVFLLAAQMAQCTLPVVSAITGHCLASGTLLAVFCDYRVMAEGPFKIGFNEVRVGVALPECFQYALRRVVGALNAERMFVFGKILDPQQALSIGLVDELAAPDDVAPRARARLQELLDMPRHGVDAMRSIARHDLAERFADVERLPLDDFVDAFLKPETQAVLRHVVEQAAARFRQAGGAAHPAAASGVAR